MPVHTICPTCNAGYDLADILRGKRVICQNCNDAFLVQEAVTASGPAVGAAVPVGMPGGYPPPQVPAAAPAAAPGGMPDARPKPPPLPHQQAGYDLNPPGQAVGYQSEVPVATLVADDAPQPAAPSQWDELPRRRPRRRHQASGGMPTGAIVALIVGPIVLLLAIGLLLWWVLTPRRTTVWVDDEPQQVQPARPGFVPVVVPGPRFNNPPPVRINPPPVRFNPPPPVRFNPPPRIRFR
jgi:hypothetical protein